MIRLRQSRTYAHDRKYMIIATLYEIIFKSVNFQGMAVGQMGPTFLDLQIITNTDLEKASAFFTGASIGYLAGSITAGALYSRVSYSRFVCLQ